MSNNKEGKLEAFLNGLKDLFEKMKAACSRACKKQTIEIENKGTEKTAPKAETFKKHESEKTPKAQTATKKNPEKAPEVQAATKKEPEKAPEVQAATKKEPEKAPEVQATTKKEPEKVPEVQQEPCILFDDIENHDEIFNRILKELATVKANLKLNKQEDQVIFTDILNTVERKINKIKKEIDKNIEKENIYDDEYSQTATIKLIGILNSEYKKLINVTINKIENNQEDNKTLNTVLDLLENFLFDLGFVKKNYDANTIDIFSDSVPREFDILPISTNNPTEDNKVSKIEELPYLIKYIDDTEEETIGVLKGTLFLMKYKGENK